jgi:hypothetical protein
MKKIVIVWMGSFMILSTACSRSQEKPLTPSTAVQSSEADTTGETMKELETEPAKAGEISLNDLYQQIKEAYGADYLPNMPYSEDMLESKFQIGKDLYDEYIAEGSAISVQIEEFAAIHAKQGKGEQIEQLFYRYQQKLIENSVQYPANQYKIQGAKIVRDGDYVFFVMLGGLDKNVQDKNEDEILQAVEEKNQIAIDVIQQYFA